FYDGALDTIRIKPAVALQFKLLPVFYNSIGYSKPAYLSLVVVISHEFENCTSKASLNAAILHGNYLPEACKYFVQQGCVERFRKTHVIMRNADILAVESFTNLHGKVAYMPQRQNSKFTAFTNYPARTYLDFLHGSLPFRQHTLPSRITNRKRLALARQLSSIHQVAQFGFIHRR